MGRKVFAIGHFKTGTSSYSTAIGMLGLRDLHFPRKYAASLNATGSVWWTPGMWIPSGRGGQQFFAFQKWDSMSNVNEVEYAQCDQVYPDSRFVLTTRNVESWLRSIRRHMATPWNEKLRGLFDGRFLKIFGCTCKESEFDEGHFREVFLRHGEAVRDYFSGSKSDQLLVLELEAPNKMELLTRFLGKPIPYPKANVTGQRRIPARMVGRPGEAMVMGAGGLQREFDYQQAG